MEDEYNDIVTYTQDQKYQQNANESIKKMPVSLYCSFLIAPSVFSNVYSSIIFFRLKSYNVQCYPRIYFDIKFLPLYLENI